MCLCCCWLLIIKSAATRCFVFHYDFLLDTWYVMAWRIDPLPPTLTNKRQARSRCQTISMNPLTSVYSESSTASEAPSEQVLSVRIGDDGHTSVGRPHGSLLFPHWRCTFLQMSLHWCPPASQVLLFSQLHLFPPAVARLPLLVAMICDNGLEVGQISQSKWWLLLFSPSITKISYKSKNEMRMCSYVSLRSWTSLWDAPLNTLESLTLLWNTRLEQSLVCRTPFVKVQIPRTNFSAKCSAGFCKFLSDNSFWHPICLVILFFSSYSFYFGSYVRCDHATLIFCAQTWYYLWSDHSSFCVHTCIICDPATLAFVLRHGIIYDGRTSMFSVHT